MTRWSLSNRAAAVGASPMWQLFALLAQRPDVLSFAVGAPDPRLFPVDMLGTAVNSVLARSGPAALQYGMTRGMPAMIDAADALLAGRGIHCRRENVHIATGASGALNNLCMALVSPGDTVLVESPSYAPAIAVFRSYGARVLEVERDRDGMIPDALEARIHSARASLVYLMPTFQNPTGTTVPQARRGELADVAEKLGVLLIEDDVYWDFRYRGASVPTMWSYVPDRVVYITSLSKTLAPALRIGIAVIPDGVLEPVLALKQLVDMQTSTFTQAVAAELLASDEFREHLDTIVALYAVKMSTLLGALRRNMPAEFEWTSPDGGLFTWIRGPKQMDSTELLRRALDNGVAFLPGTAFHADSSTGRNTMRLSIAMVNAKEIDRGIKVLGKLCVEACRA